jgi:hypothetical protein
MWSMDARRVATALKRVSSRAMRACDALDFGKERHESKKNLAFQSDALFHLAAAAAASACSTSSLSILWASLTFISCNVFAVFQCNINKKIVLIRHPTYASRYRSTNVLKFFFARMYFFVPQKFALCVQ